MAQDKPYKCAIIANTIVALFLMNYDKYPESVSTRNYEDTKRPVGETLFHVSFLCVINYDQLITGPQITLETNSKLPKLPR